jgi:hypothetical protein
MPTPNEILEEIGRQIEWSGPNGKHLGHVVLKRDDAICLLEWLKSLESERATIEQKSGDLAVLAQRIVERDEIIERLERELKDARTR